jgi:hypothetical protein
MASEKSRASYAAWYARNKEKAREQKRVVMKKLRDENPEKYNSQSRKAKIREKLKLFLMYGNVCQICGFSDMRALSLDHVKDNGNEERRQLGERGVYRRAKSEYRPDEYQILCMNCQFIKRSVNSVHINLNDEWQQQHGKS